MTLAEKIGRRVETGPSTGFTEGGLERCSDPPVDGQLDVIGTSVYYTIHQIYYPVKG